jgi:hypothetical protein
MSKPSLRIEHPAHGVLRTYFRGELGEEEVSTILAATSGAMAREGRLTLFHDWEGMTRYAPSVRTRLTAWAVTQREHIDGLHILLEVRGPVISMAIAATNLVLGGMMNVHERRAEFERDFRRAVLKARRDGG